MIADAEAEAPAALSLQELRNSAELLEREVVALHRATDAELDARRPAADVPAATLASAWFAYCCWLAERKGGAAAPSARPLAQVLHESLADEPMKLTLAHGYEMRVHAKSFNTLLVLDGLQSDLQHMFAQLHAVWSDDELLDGAAGARLVARLRESRTVRRWAWILDHPGPRLPFADDAVEAEPPEWTLDLQAVDIERIWLAHIQVNRRDIELLAAAFPAEQQAQHSRLQISGFLGTKADGDGVEPKVYFFDRSMRSIFATCIVRAETHRQAMADARRGGAAA